MFSWSKKHLILFSNKPSPFSLLLLELAFEAALLPTREFLLSDWRSVSTLSRPSLLLWWELLPSLEPWLLRENTLSSRLGSSRDCLPSLESRPSLESLWLRDGGTWSSRLDELLLASRGLGLADFELELPDKKFVNKDSDAFNGVLYW